MWTSWSVARAQAWRRLPPRKAADGVTTSLLLQRRLHERVMVAVIRLNHSLTESTRDAPEALRARHVEALREPRS